MANLGAASANGVKIADRAIIAKLLSGKDLAVHNNLVDDAQAFERLHIHVVVENQMERASTARSIFAMGHHAEVYSDVHELCMHAPEKGIIMSREDGTGSVQALLGALQSHGLWMPVVGFAEAISCDVIVEGVKSGVLDYYVGDWQPSSVSAKLKKAAHDGMVLIMARQRQTRAKMSIAMLSPRESEVLTHLAAGHSNKEMARLMAISPRTVEIHRMKMMGKLGAKTSADAIRFKLEAVGML
jgi:FixJ family two-component response regulator